MLDANEILLASHNQSDTFSPLDYAHVLKFLRRDDGSPHTCKATAAISLP